jgi:hypothetical protein
VWTAARRATTPSYRCADPKAILIPIADVIGPGHRKLNRDALADILRGFLDGDDIPPVEVFMEPHTHEVHLLHGAHCWQASLAFGFVQIPCEPKTREFAEVARGYPPRP